MEALINNNDPPEQSSAIYIQFLNVQTLINLMKITVIRCNVYFTIMYFPMTLKELGTFICLLYQLCQFCEFSRKNNNNWLLYTFAVILKSIFYELIEMIRQLELLFVSRDNTFPIHALCRNRCYIQSLCRVAWPPKKKKKKKKKKRNNFSGLCSDQQLSFSPCWIKHLFLIIITPRWHQIWLRTCYFMSNFLWTVIFEICPISRVPRHD